MQPTLDGGRFAKNGGFWRAQLCTELVATSDGLSLTKYFMRIKDPKLRRFIVHLVEQIATRYN
jgi:hypothetical protein